MELEAPVGDLAYEAAGLELGDRGEAGRVLAPHVCRCGGVVVVLEHVDLGGQFGEAVLEVLVLHQRPAEGHTLLEVLLRLLQGHLAGAHRAVGGPHALDDELRHLLLEAHSFDADDVLDRNPHVGERQEAGV